MMSGGDGISGGATGRPANLTNPLSSNASSLSSSNVLNNVFDSSWRDILHHPEREHFRLDRNSINHLIMNYLVTEGFKEAAEKFQREAGLPGSSVPAKDDKYRSRDTLNDRDTIRQAIQDGNIEEAISLCNELYPELLDNNAYLYFHLKQQHLLELIRNQRVEEAIEYAQEHLTERSGDDPKIMEEIERSMALLAFDDPLNCPFGDLLKMSHRQRVASEVNMAILQSEELLTACNPAMSTVAEPLQPSSGSAGSAAAATSTPSLLFLRNMMLVMQDGLEKNKVKPDRKMDARGQYLDALAHATSSSSVSNAATAGTVGVGGAAAMTTSGIATAPTTTSAAVSAAAAAAAIALGESADIPMAT